MSADTPAPPRGRLVLVPNALDFGAAPTALDEVLPHAVLRRAATLTHWLVEDAKSARAFLKRVHEFVPLSETLQSLHITELPRPVKGREGHRGPDAKSGRSSGAGLAGGDAPHAVPTAAAALAELLAPAQAGHDIGLLSEAGLPAVADPGAALVATAHALGLDVLPLAGPSSLLLALAASGLDGQSFAFVGYLPQTSDARRERIRELEATSRHLRQTQIFIETPYRNAVLMAALIECAAANTRISVSVGLTLAEGWSRTTTVATWRKLRPTLPDRLPAVFLLQA